MPIPEGHKANLDTIIRAVHDDALVVIEVYHKPSKSVRHAIAAVGFDGHEYTIFPFALLFEGDPCDEVLPPEPGGGFRREDGAIVIPDRSAA